VNQENYDHVPAEVSGIPLRKSVLPCSVEILVVMDRLHVQRVVVGQMQIPLSVIRVGDVIHCHTIVVGTGNPQCRIRFRKIPEG
jgi:hypothetical protein